MVAGGHFVKKKKKKSCVSIWNGKNCDRKLFSDIQNGRRKILYRSEMARIAIESELQTSKIADRSEMARKWFSNIQNVRRWPFCKKIKKKPNSVLI